MTEPYILWALVVGGAIGVALTWFALGRLPRRSDDVSLEERLVEAAWISSTVSGRGQQVSEEVVEEVLALHQAYLSGPAAHLSPVERDTIAVERARRAEIAMRRARAQDERAAQGGASGTARVRRRDSQQARDGDSGEG
ncbi:hypothetical protein BH24CHL6_BH24CHL6_06780 [soil metagenome]